MLSNLTELATKSNASISLPRHQLQNQKSSPLFQDISHKPWLKSLSLGLMRTPLLWESNYNCRNKAEDLQVPCQQLSHPPTALKKAPERHRFRPMKKGKSHANLTKLSFGEPWESPAHTERENYFLPSEGRQTCLPKCIPTLIRSCSLLPTWTLPKFMSARVAFSWTPAHLPKSRDRAVLSFELG